MDLVEITSFLAQIEYGYPTVFFLIGFLILELFGVERNFGEKVIYSIIISMGVSGPFLFIALYATHGSTPRSVYWVGILEWIFISMTTFILIVRWIKSYRKKRA